MKTLLLFTLLLLVAADAVNAQANRVLVVVNERSSISKEIGRYYRLKRRIPAKNICTISTEPVERTDLSDYHQKIRRPILLHISRNKLDINYIVTTKGVPLYVWNNEGFSVDSMLTMLTDGWQKKMRNPYFNRSQRFDSNLFGFVLVTRLDGYTLNDAKGLIDRSIASKGKRGTILIDVDPYHDTRAGYAAVNADMRNAAIRLHMRGIPTILDTTKEFVGGKSKLMGYYSWGSNDTAFDRKKYLSNRFLPGAIAETVVSTSARRFSPEKTGQSLIADLIRMGVTGVKGYASEPYADSMAKASILFDRYTLGYNLAESFYMASPYICWKDVVIGDPLCAPYAK